MKRLQVFSSIYARIVGVVLLFVGSLFLMSYDDSNDFETAKNLDIFYSIFQEINSVYVDEINSTDLMTYTIEKMLEGLDPYTKFIPESDVERFRISIKGEYAGIGALTSSRDSIIEIVEIFENSPAHKSGLLPGDKLLKIDGKSVVNKSKDFVQELVQGQINTKLTMSVLRNKQLKDITITREKIEIKSVPHSTLIDSEIGYIRLQAFTQNSAQDVKNALIALKAKGAKSLVLDLRNNPGGLLIEAVDIVNLFVPQNKLIVFTKGKNLISDSKFITKHKPIDTTIPIVVLVSSKSASASEIVAGALQDLDRAVILGEQTFGKGLVQVQRDIKHNSILKITTSKYYIPSGRCIQKMDYSNHFSPVKGIENVAYKVFYTSNKRPVSEAGGVKPDVFVGEDSLSNYVGLLASRFVFNDFVNLYYSFRDTTTISLANFSISSATFDKFVAFAKTYQLASKTSQELVQLKKQSENEKLGVESQIDALIEIVKAKEETLLEKHKKEIITYLNSLIVQRLYFERGKIQYQMAQDNMIEQAKKYLLQKQLYSQIVEGKTGEHKK